jgi:hypothetical protein
MKELKLFEGKHLSPIMYLLREDKDGLIAILNNNPIVPETNIIQLEKGQATKKKKSLIFMCDPWELEKKVEQYVKEHNIYADAYKVKLISKKTPLIPLHKDTFRIDLYKINNTVLMYNQPSRLN